LFNLLTLPGVGMGSYQAPVPSGILAYDLFSGTARTVLQSEEVAEELLS
jgi:hypothetical protein